MRQHVLSSSIALGFLCAACGGSGKSSAPAKGGEPGLAVGDYACSFTGYPEFLCRVTQEGAALVLEKLGGSDRFRGYLRVKGDVVLWTNDVTGGSPEELSFAEQADGAWYAALPSDGEQIGYRLRALGPLGSQFGGQAYGGAIGEAPQ